LSEQELGLDEYQDRAPGGEGQASKAALTQDRAPMLRPCGLPRFEKPLARRGYWKVPMTDRPKPPAHLSRRAKAIWRDLVAEYTFAAHELTLLRAACETVDRLEEARALIARDGLVVAGYRGQPRPNPMLAVERDCRIALARLWRELAMRDPDESRPPRIPGRY